MPLSSDRKKTDQFSHIDSDGNAVMVDVGRKLAVKRTAKARGVILLAPETVLLLRDKALKKGDVLTVAKIAGIQAAKETARLIPLCHPLSITQVDISFEIAPDRITVFSHVECVERTGIEMEALTAASIALLTIYDMCKAVDKNMEIASIVLTEKTKQEE